MQETDKIDKESHAGVKGELVGNLIPPDGIRMRTRGAKSDGSRRYPDESHVNRIQGHICKYVSRGPVIAIFV